MGWENQKVNNGYHSEKNSVKKKKFIGTKNDSLSNKLFLFLVADKSDVFFNKFILTRFPEAPDLEDV